MPLSQYAKPTLQTQINQQNKVKKFVPTLSFDHTLEAIHAEHVNQGCKPGKLMYSDLSDQVDMRGFSGPCRLLSANHDCKVEKKTSKSSRNAVNPIRRKNQVPGLHLQIDTKYYPECPETGFRYLVLMVCVLSRMAWALPLAKLDGAAVAQWIRQVAAAAKLCPSQLTFYGDDCKTKNGMELHHDGGTEFRNSAVKEAVHSLGGVTVMGPPYTPQLMGIVERLNKTIENYLRAVLRDRKSVV